MLSTADETLLSAEVGIIVIQLYMRTTPRTQDSSPHQDYEPFLGAGIPTETFIGDWNPGCRVDRGYTVLLHMFNAWNMDTLAHSRHSWTFGEGVLYGDLSLVCTEHCVEQKLLEGL